MSHSVIDQRSSIHNTSEVGAALRLLNIPDEDKICAKTFVISGSCLRGNNRTQRILLASQMSSIRYWTLGSSR